MKPTQLQFLTETKYDNKMFIPISISDTHKQLLKIKKYQNKDYIFIPNHKITGQKHFIKNNIYQVDISSRKWCNHTVIKYHIYNTLETIEKNESKCLFI